MLVGHPRSGTTVLARGIGSHPDVGYWEEPRLLFWFRRQLRQLRPIAEHLLADASVDELWHTQRDTNLREQFRTVEGLDRRDVEAVALAAARAATRELHRQFLRAADASLLLEKTPMELQLLGRLGRWFPDARSIHLVRDVRDVVCSAVDWEKQWGRPRWLRVDGPIIEATATQWAELVGRAQREGRGTLTVRYEDLVADGAQVIRTCLEHLGLQWHPSIDRFVQHGMAGIHARSTRRWVQELSAGEIDVVLERAGETLEAVGYRTDSAR